jgi:hypothetical protein
MSENRKPREVHDTVATRLSNLSNQYLVYVKDEAADVHIPVAYTPRFTPGGAVTPELARALNWAHVEKASMSASMALRKHSDMPDNLKGEFVTRHVADYNFPSDFGDLGGNMLTRAAMEIAMELGKAQLSGLTDAKRAAKAAKAVEAILNTPSVADKYTDRVSQIAAGILATRKPVSKRTKGSDTESDAGDIAV